MCSQNTTSKSTDDYLQKIELLKEKLLHADKVLVGAGAGLSTAAGFTYSGERFTKNFSDFEKKYGFHDMYSGGFYPYETKEEFWGYWSRYIYVNRYMDSPKEIYEELFKVVKDKDYFVLTTNVDHCFQKAGFDKNRLFYTQGDYGLFQCSKPCHNETYDNELFIEKMVKDQKDMKIPTSLIPHCPKCKRPMTMNLRSDETFVEDKGWNAASKRYENFVEQMRNTKANILCLELGVGYNTPGIIKYNFQSIVAKTENSTYASVNTEDYNDIPEYILPKSIFLQAGCDKVIESLL
jgi:NAD-dependent SIR2 family protein deacetylase